MSCPLCQGEKRTLASTAIEQLALRQQLAPLPILGGCNVVWLPQLSSFP